MTSFTSESGWMRVEILHIDECPNWQEAGVRVRAALDATGHSEAAIEYRLLTSSADAATVAFAGSPTILVDGTDAFPSDGRTSDLACRVYQTETGLAGMPTIGQLTVAIGKRTAR